MALGTLIVPDLERLSSVDTMYMRRMRLRYCVETDFFVFTDTEELYHLRELERELCTLPFGAQPWYLVQGLIPTTGEQAFLIRRAVTSLSEKLQVIIGDNVMVNLVRQKACVFKQIIHINNAVDDLVLRLKGTMDMKNYVLQTKDKTPIGSIFKVTCSSPEELLPHLDDYVIKVPVDLAADLKVSVIAACFLINVT